MKKKLFNNIGLKILALLSAVLVWWVVMNIDDPLKKITLNGIPVELRNTEELTNKGYIYEVTSGATVSITVRAPQSVADSLKATDFIAYADLSQLNPLTDSATIVIECAKSDVKGQIVDISSRIQVVKLSIDNKETADIPVEVEIAGTPASDYVIGEKNISQTRIQVTGAASVIDKIAKAVVSYDVSDMTSSVNEKVIPVFYDEAGNKIDISGLELSRSSLTLTVEILPTKWVNINVTPSGSVAEGYKMTGYTQNIQQVKLAGTRTNLNAINSIDLPADAVVMDNIEESTDYSVIIANYISGSYKIVSDTKALVVHVDVEPLETKSFIISKGRIRVNNLAERYEMEFLENTVEIKITAIHEVLEDFNLDALNVNVDLQGLGAGEHDVIINMSENDNFDVVGIYTIKVNIINPEAPTEEPESGQGESVLDRKR